MVWCVAMSTDTHQTSPWLTTDQAAAYLRISKNTLYRWALSGAVKYHEGPGGNRRYRAEDLDAALVASRTTADE